MPEAVFIRIEADDRQEAMCLAFQSTLNVLGPDKTFLVVRGVRHATTKIITKREQENRPISNRTLYTFAIQTLNAFGIGGLPASAIIKEAWRPGTYRMQEHPTHTGKATLH